MSCPHRTPCTRIRTQVYTYTFLLCSSSATITITRSILSLQRRLCLAIYFNRPPHCTDKRIPYNPYKKHWLPPPSQRWSSTLSSYIKSIHTHALNTLLDTKTHFTPTDKILLNALTCLKRNKRIVIKPADKNLDLVVLDSHTYRDMYLSHLIDTST
jgi:hypothetical protein